MAIEVYNGLYSGQELDAAVTVVNAVVPSTATAQNKLATEADISQLDTTVSGLVSDVADIQGDIDNILDDVSDLDTSVSTINSTITDIQGDITDIDGKIPSSASSQNQLATAADVGQVSGTVGNLSTSVSNIQAVIPSTATSSNKLATMADIPSGGSGIAGVQINGVDLTPDANNKVSIPIGRNKLGVVNVGQYAEVDSRGTLKAITEDHDNCIEMENSDPTYYDNLFISKYTLFDCFDKKNLNNIEDETWTFVVDDGQGGTTTVTKTIKTSATYTPTSATTGDLYGLVDGEFHPITVTTEYWDNDHMIEIKYETDTTLYTYDASTGTYTATSYVYPNYPDPFPDDTYYFYYNVSTETYPDGYVPVKRFTDVRMSVGILEFDYSGQRYVKS